MVQPAVRASKESDTPKLKLAEVLKFLMGPWMSEILRDQILRRPLSTQCVRVCACVCVCVRVCA